MSFLAQHLAGVLVKSLDKQELDRILTQLNLYLDLLEKWNKVYNLTAIRERDEMEKLHVLDSLAVFKFIQGKRIIDVGTGAGLPGVVLAIVNPELEVTLLDSNGKKTRFLQEVQRVLGLENINVVRSRVLDYQVSTKFSTVVSRAFASIEKMQQGSQHLLAKDGIWVAMKGKNPVDELVSIDGSYQVNTYKVPGVGGERCCVVLSENSY